MEDNHKILILTSVTSEDVAIQIAQELLESHTAACINIIPKVRSIYRWKGNICDDRESILFIKSRSDKFSEVKEIIKGSAGYECPEVLSFKIEDGARQFLDWIDSSIKVGDD